MELPAMDEDEAHYSIPAGKHARERRNKCRRWNSFVVFVESKRGKEGHAGRRPFEICLCLLVGWMARISVEKPKGRMKGKPHEQKDFWKMWLETCSDSIYPQMRVIILRDTLGASSWPLLGMICFLDLIHLYCLEFFSVSCWHLYLTSLELILLLQVLFVLF